MRRRRASPVRDLIVVLVVIAVWSVAVSWLFTHRPAVAVPDPYRLGAGRQAAFPVEYWIDARFTPDENLAIREAFATWGRVSGTPVFFRYRGTSEATGPAVDGRTTVIRSSVSRAPNAGIAEVVRRLAPAPVGAPRVYADADIVLDFSGRVPWSTNAEPGKQDLQAVVTHEIGHVLGLENVDDPAQLMYGYSEPVDGPAGHPARRELGPGDIEGLLTAYPERHASL